MKRRRSPREVESRARDLGVDELVGRLEWVLSGRPIALRNARQKYRQQYLGWYRRLERAGRERDGVR